MAALYELVGFSSYPYAKSPATEYEEDALLFNWAFKNGRGDPRLNSRTFAEVVRHIVRGTAMCPVFAEPSVLVPIPRSGSSRLSFEQGASTWPTHELAVALAEVGVEHAAELLLTRPKALQRSSDGAERVSVEEHITSLQVRVDRDLHAARIVLLDDLLVKGTQAIACLVALRRAGYTGSIEGYFVHQAIAPNPTADQRQPFLRHHITWEEGQRLAQRSEVGQWRTRHRVSS